MEALEAQITTTASDTTATHRGGENRAVPPVTATASGRADALRARDREGDRARASGSATIKRGMDLLLSVLLLVATAPVSLLATLAIRLTDGGPAIYWQRRVGRHGREFWFPKFRSMQDGAEHANADLQAHADWPESITFKMRNDPRVTSVGRIIRTLSIDELPQLWCVLKGDMSLVGPRPPLPSEVAWYGAEAHRRLEVKPGLTCIWQVNGRSLIPFEGQLALDLRYIREQTVWLDIKLLLRTIPAVVSCRGAY